MSELVNVPSIFLKNEEEAQIKVNYYNNLIELQQYRGYDEPETIGISYEAAKEMFKEILKHIPEAKMWLEKR